MRRLGLSAATLVLVGLASAAAATPIISPIGFTPVTGGTEGSPMSFDSGATGVGTLTYSWDFGDATAARVGIDLTSLFHTYVDNAIDPTANFTLTLTVTDDTGSAEGTAEVPVFNVAPSIEPVDNAINPTGNFVLDISFMDPGADTHTATIAWGDGSPVEPGVVSGGTVTGSHPYGILGSFEVLVTVTDDDGGVGQETFTVTIVPEPATALLLASGLAVLAFGRRRLSVR